MQNRRVLPPLNLEKAKPPGGHSPYSGPHVRVTTPEENKAVDEAIARRKKFDEGKAKAQGAYKQVLKEGAMKRSYTIDEMTVATMLKGHPQAEEIVDNLFKSKKEKNESGEEFQDGSEDTIGGEGHAAVARPDSIKHEGKPSGVGPNEPGTGTKKASIEDGDLEKSDNLADNLPEEFEDEMEDDDTIPAEKGGAKKSLSLDELTISHLVKTMGSDRIEEEILKAGNAASIYTTPGALSSKTSGGYEGVKTMKELDKFKQGKPSALDPKKESNDSSNKSEESDLEKGRGDQKEERAEWAKDKEKEEEEHMKDKSYSLDFSKSILERMGLEKGATSVSKEAGGGKATQINYGTKPTTRFKHPKAKSDKKYIHSPEKGTVKVEKEGEKTKEIGVSEESKLKNASVSSADLYKSLNAIWQRRSTNMKFSKSIIDRLVFTDVDYLSKDLREGYKKEYVKQAGKDYDVKAERDFQQGKAFREKHGRLPGADPSSERHAAEIDRDIEFREKHKKSLFSTFDAILEKGRKRESERQGPKRVQESEGEGVELPGGSMATMGNPGGSKEKASFERAEPGAIKNLKKLAESPNKMDRKAAEAGMKRH